LYNFADMEPTTKLLFVCLGNICRSPAAEGVMRRLVEREGLDAKIECDSAGTYGGHAGELPDARMRRAASARGYDLTQHRARQFRTDDFDRFDMIFTMDDSNYERVHRLAPTVEAAQKIFRMTDFCRRGANAPHPDATHVPDPYYEGAEGFEKVLDLLEDACGGLLQDVKKGL
jgi:protein-tyrosine phosphatase